jgi:hypothetical protein
MNVTEQVSIYNQGVAEGKRQAAQKHWVSLTDERITEIWEIHPYFNDFARTIEAKLKALNYPISDN